MLKSLDGLFSLFMPTITAITETTETTAMTAATEAACIHDNNTQVDITPADICVKFTVSAGTGCVGCEITVPTNLVFLITIFLIASVHIKQTSA